MSVRGLSPRSGPMWVLGCALMATALSAIIGVRAVTAQTAEEREVIAAVQALFDAMAARDGQAFRAGMLPDGFLVAVGYESMSRTSRDDFATRLPDAGFVMHERMWDPEVRSDGPVATVWAPYDFYRGIEFSHCGTDAIQLAKTLEGWKVAWMSYTVQRPPDCSTHPEGPPGND